MTELSGGARIYHIFHETFGRSLSAVDALDGLTEGVRLSSLFLSTYVLSILCFFYFSRIRGPPDFKPLFFAGGSDVYKGQPE